MKSISQSAAQTIVLDSDIWQLTSSSGIKEIFTRIAYSSWSSRLWTLQEAVYTQNLVFRFSDESVSLDTLVMKSGDMPPDWELAWSVRFPYNNLRRYLNSNQARSEGHFTLLFKALSGRVTSDPADEPLVIGNLLGIDHDGIEISAELSGFLQRLGDMKGIQPRIVDGRALREMFSR